MKSEQFNLDDKINMMVALKRDFTDYHDKTAELLEDRDSNIDLILYWYEKCKSVESTYNKVVKAAWNSI